MMGNILGRVIAGVATLVILTGIRLYFGYYMLSQVRNMHTDTAYHSRYRLNPDIAKAPPLPPDHSGWVVFNTGDTVAGTMTRHAKLVAATMASPAGQTMPPSALELISGKAAGNHVLLTLPGLLAHTKPTSLNATFDTYPPVQVAIKSVNEAQSVVEVSDYVGFMDSLRNADTVVIQGSDMDGVTFAVGGLSWD